LLSEDADVVITSRSQEKLAVAKNQLKGNFSSYQLDASDENSVIRFFVCIEEFDGLVSTIKPEHLTSGFENSKLEDTRKAFEAKFWGQYQLVRHSLKHSRKRGVLF
jgi:NAD(P)-dependent dehydrogenase (short-subunit alcohol dehydrogenase family)